MDEVNRREIPTPDTSRVWGNRHFTPVNRYEALMTADIGCEPAEDAESLQQFREVMAFLQTLLTEEQQFVLNSVYAEQHGVRATARRMGMRHPPLIRKRDKALRELQALAEQHPVVRERLGMNVCWESAAFGAVCDVWDIYGAYMDGADDEIDLQSITRNAWLNLGGTPTPVARAAAVGGLTQVGGWAMQRYRKRLELTTIPVITKVTATLVSKQHDYGHGNINAFGLQGVVVRMSDKVARYMNLAGRDEEAVNESLDDTLLDMVGYAAIARMLHENTFYYSLSGDPAILDLLTEEETDA